MLLKKILFLPQNTTDDKYRTHGLQGYGLQGLLNFTAYLIALAIQFWHE